MKREALLSDIEGPDGQLLFTREEAIKLRLLNYRRADQVSGLSGDVPAAIRFATLLGIPVHDMSEKLRYIDSVIEADHGKDCRADAAEHFRIEGTGFKPPESGSGRG
jgi:hypothetical protein